MLTVFQFQKGDLSLSWFQCKAIALKFYIASLGVSNTEETRRMHPGLVTAMGGKPPEVLHPDRVTDISSFLEASLTFLRKVLPPQRPPQSQPCLLTYFTKEWCKPFHLV